MRISIVTAPIVALFAFALSGCFSPVSEPDCLLDGRCECKTRVDCSADRDCVDGKCFLMIDAGIGELGWPCTASTECLRGPCLPKGPGNGNICTVSCDADGGYGCPRGWQCKPNTSGSGAPFACTPPIANLCLACASDSDCNAIGDRCLTIGSGRFCAKDCTVTNACDPGFTCRSVMLDASVSRQCVPDLGTCECSIATQGLKRSCKRGGGSALGTCFGFETCRADGTWSGCDARDASVEICDGVDNDCDGLTDQADPKLVTSGVPNYPNCIKGLTCTGKWFCGPLTDGGVAFQCSAPDPREETCNGADDNCNGVVDDGLTDSMGTYVSARACGSCATDCYQVLSNLEADAGVVVTGAATCELRQGKRTCVPQRCAKGYYPAPVGNAVVCTKAVTSQCRACTTTGDCLVPGDVCTTVGTDPGKFCAQSCDSNSPYLGCTGKVGERDCCPADSLCQAVNGQRVCVPKGDSCQCSSANAGFTRSCFKSTSTGTCVGEQTCTNGSYGTCDTSKTTAEFCDGQDNDCDGVVDNGFIDTRRSGTYDTDQNCGACQNDCTVKWSASIQHAVGGCRVAIGRTPLCSIVACTTETVGGGGNCRTDAECGSHRTCSPTYHQCVEACSASTACSDSADRCVGGFCTRSCTADAQCIAAYGAPSVCSASGTCQVSYQFVNVDNEDTNGCECAANQGSVDEPDLSATYPTPGLPYVDRDCDAVDGHAASALYVWAQSTSSQGTRTAPYKTISEAIAAFKPGVHSAILVAQGSYVEQVVLTNGASLYGGYSSDFTRRDVILFPTLIEAAEPAASSTIRGTVNAENLTSRTVLAGFSIRAYDVISRPTPGIAARNAYGVYVKNAPALVIQNNHIVGGSGGDNVPAESGTAGANGGSGAAGLVARECNSPNCVGESQQGGSAGVNPACSTMTSGNPGARSDLSVDPQGYSSNANGNGVGGANATYSHSDSSQSAFCKYDCTVPESLTGGAAQNGQDGAPGLPGAACTSALGSIVGDDWVTTVGAPGSSGSVGRGGGGGGAGGCVRNANPASCTIGRRVGDLGGTGGGGGAGGCGGGRGLGAAGGGASFAIFIVGATPSIDGNLIDLGFGGQGGYGGVGGYGGLGGQGGRGGGNTTAAWCAGQGGPGGRGGNGGAGSGGGAGCGGSVFGIAGQGISAAKFDTRNTFAPTPMNAAGQGGIGGASPAGASFKGGDGATGVVNTVQSF